MALAPFSFIKSLTDALAFPKPGNRAMLQKLHDETKDYINNTLKVAVDDINISVDGLNTSFGNLSPTFISPSLLNGWANIGSPQEDIGYYKDSAGWVYLKGSAHSGVMKYAMFKLPTGYIPTRNRHFACSSNDGSNDIFGSIFITNNGDVIPGVGNNTTMCLEAISFYVGV